MKQCMRLQNEEVYSKALNPYLKNWTDQCIMWETSQKKLFAMG